MKKIISLFMVLFPFVLFGQSTTILPIGLQNYVLKTPLNSIGFNHSYETFSMGTYIDSNAGWLQSNTNNQLFLGSGLSGGVLLNYNGNVQFTRHVKFGADAPEISQRDFIGNTNVLDGAQYVIVTNIAQDKVLSANLVVDLGAAGFVPDNYKYSNGYQVELRIEDNFIYVNNVAGNSYNILNKPFKLTIFIKK
jgi:hypothetical protein